MRDLQMDIIPRLAYFLFCAYFGDLVLVSGCPFEVCYCDGNEINCQGRFIISLPPVTGTVPAHASLMFDTNQITTIPSNILPNNLEQLSLLFNPVSTIDDSAFDGSASTLDTLVLSTFRFTRIPNALSHLNNLKYLTILDATINDWNEAVMKHIGPNLQTLFLQNVGLNGWPSWIQYFSELTELSLESANIRTIPDNALDMLANKLTGFSLVNNSLTSVPKALSNLKALQTLQLSNNSIVDVTWLPQASKLSILSFDFNSISDAGMLSNVLRAFYDSLNELTLKGNHLSQFPDLSFLAHVDGLDFTYNRISQSDLGALPKNIKEVYLAFNSLTRIPSVIKDLPYLSELLMTQNAVTEIRDVDCSPWLLSLDLSYNRVRALSDNSFPKNSNITSLDLESNPLTTISAHVFDNLPQLMVLDFTDTKLTRLPLGLAALTKVNYFYISNSDGLICTCAEKSLASWILGRPNELDSKCGQTTVHDFYATYSQSCP